MHNLIFDFGNVLVQWQPERVYLPYFHGDEAQYWYFWRHVCTQEMRNPRNVGSPTSPSPSTCSSPIGKRPSPTKCPA